MFGANLDQLKFSVNHTVVCLPSNEYNILRICGAHLLNIYCTNNCTLYIVFYIYEIAFFFLTILKQLYTNSGREKHTLILFREKLNR